MRKTTLLTLLMMLCFVGFQTITRTAKQQVIFCFSEHKPRQTCN